VATTWLFIILFYCCAVFQEDNDRAKPNDASSSPSYLQNGADAAEMARPISVGRVSTGPDLDQRMKRQSRYWQSAEPSGGTANSAVAVLAPKPELCTNHRIRQSAAVTWRAKKLYNAGRWEEALCVCARSSGRF
jgi:hypothetical protein